MSCDSVAWFSSVLPPGLLPTIHNLGSLWSPEWPCGPDQEVWEEKLPLGAEVFWVTKARVKGDGQDSGSSPSGSTGILGGTHWFSWADEEDTPKRSTKVMEAPAIGLK